MKALLLVFLGGGIGSVLRQMTVLGMARAGITKDLPWSILAANLLGSFLLGLLAGMPAVQRGGAVWFFAATGVLGGYTTFSTLSNDSFELLASGRTGAAMLNLFGSAVLGIACAALGFQTARTFCS
jgi:CrcB protein